MSDKIKGFVVALDHEMGDEHAAFIKQVIMQIKGVISVDASVVNYDDYMNRQRVKNELWEKMMEVFKS